MTISAALSVNAQATLLLTSYFNKAGSEDARPLSTGEWGRFAVWLKENSIAPADLLASEPGSMLSSWHDSRISTDRILQLLKRGHSLALAVEKWQRAGLWVITRSDPEYPKRLKYRLKTASPPVLFGCGEKSLLNAGGLAVVGSRKANELDLAFTEQVGAKAASEGVAIVSGGARGVDETAMQGAINSGGAVIGVMADSLLRAATSSKWRKGLMDGHVVLVSPFYPEAGFNAGNAMARNKYIYCLADSALVIHSGKKGGTLNGAEENLKKSWVPLWVKPTDDRDAANHDLVAKGGSWCEGDIQALSINHLLTATYHADYAIKKEQPDLFSVGEAARPEPQTGLFDTVAETSQQNIPDSKSTTKEPVNDAPQEGTPPDFYQTFLDALPQLAQSPVTLEQLLNDTGLHKSQLNDWLKRALSDGVVKKLNRPVRYLAINKKQGEAYSDK
ncbi:DNA-processing protein DprA [Marinimicrobium agarilyticum]|uniref:DNA-processing protein DprA n=1 Tax=Marinimicrobium agarilyticum TaxID=306546 RepID=UPI00041DA9CF|nr:DNA-processing protein DprA [Marinimicrobium agarilyticum]